ncbi:MAG: hypothetical protein OCD01_17185 [Fibrobacterales bacterium]
MSHHSPSRLSSIWQFPWGFSEGFLVLLGLMLSGGILELIVPSLGGGTLQWPWNGVLFVGLISGAALIYSLYKKHPIVQWLSGAKAAIVSILGVCLIVMLMGTFPQWIDYANHDSLSHRLGVRSVLSAWYFFFIVLFFVISLTFATLRNILHPAKRNWGVVMSHLGLLVVTLSLAFGAGDIQKARMELTVGGGVSDRGVTDSGDSITFPFLIELTDFAVDEFNPKLATIDLAGTIIAPQTSMFEITEGKKGVIGEWEFKVEKYFELAYSMDNGEYQPVFQPGAAPAALLRLTNSRTGRTIEQWVSCGSLSVARKGIAVNDSVTFVMALPEAKRFRSTITIIEKEAQSKGLSLEVNKPIKREGWLIYQVSFDTRMGRWSQLSVIELVKDPWLPVVYTGVAMMLLGALYLFWYGKVRREKYVD